MLEECISEIGESSNTAKEYHENIVRPSECFYKLGGNIAEPRKRRFSTESIALDEKDV